MENIIDIKNFDFYYGQRKILNNISFSIQKGEIVGLLGENGSGKTTLMDSLYGFHGRFENIQVCSTYPEIDNKTIKHLVSYIQDTPNLLDYLTAAQYLKFLSKIEQIDFNKKTNEIEQLIYAFDLKKEYQTKLLKNYSFGMKKKIQIIGEFLLNKDLILIDEPTNGLDIRMIIKIKNLIKTYSESYKTTFVISSHNINFLQTVCSRVLLFHNGQIMKDINTAQDIDLESQFVSIYDTTEESL